MSSDSDFNKELPKIQFYTFLTTFFKPILRSDTNQFFYQIPMSCFSLNKELSLSMLCPVVRKQKGWLTNRTPETHLLPFS